MSRLPDRPRKRVWRWCLIAVASSLLGASFYSEWLGFAATRAFPPKGAMATIGTVRLHYLDRKPVHASRGTVVLIHGAWVAHADLWAALSPFLPHYRVIAIDRPGHGWSERPSDAQYAEPVRQAQAVMALLDRIAPEPLILVGYSLGGVLTTRIALDRPERLARLILLAAVTHPWLGQQKAYLEWFASPGTGSALNRVAAIPIARLSAKTAIRRAFAPRSAPSNFENLSELPLLFRAEAYRRNLQDLIVADATLVEQARRYSEIEVPAVVIAGDGDAFVSPVRHSAAFASAAQNAQLVILPGVGHMPHHAHPQAIARIIEGVEVPLRR